MWKSHLFHDSANKIPFNPVICFTHIEFKHHKSLLPRSFFRHWMKQFESHDCIVRNQPTRHKRSLVFSHKWSQNLFQPVGQSFWNNFVQDCTETDGSEFGYKFRIFLLWVKNNDCFIKNLTDIPSLRTRRQTLQIFFLWEANVCGRTVHENHPHPGALCKPIQETHLSTSSTVKGRSRISWSSWEICMLRHARASSTSSVEGWLQENIFAKWFSIC